MIAGAWKGNVLSNRKILDITLFLTFQLPFDCFIIQYTIPAYIIEHIDVNGERKLH